MINILADSNKIMNTSIVGSDDEHYKQRIRDLFILTKDMQKNQRVTLDEFKFFGKSSAASKDQLSFNTQRFFMNGSLKQMENEGKPVFAHSSLVDVGYTNLNQCFQKQTVVHESIDDFKSS